MNGRAGRDVRVASWELPGEITTAAQARALTRDTLAGWGVCRGGDTDDIVLMVDELVANAVVHGGGSVRLLLRVESTARGSSLTGEVSDGSSVVPQVRRAATDLIAERGRGLWLVEMLAADHGVRAEPGGKTVWFCRPLGG